MGDADALQASKKRAAGRELSRDNPGLDDEEDVSEQETGTFKRASEEVLATRRIVKVRRNQPNSAPSSNPFAGIKLVPTTESSCIPAEVTTEAKVVSDELDAKTKSCNENEKGKDEDSKLSETVNNEGESKAEVKDKDEAEAGTKDKDEAEAGTKDNEAEAGTKAKDEAEAGSKAKDEADAGTKAKDEADAGTEAGTEVKAESAAEDEKGNAVETTKPAAESEPAAGEDEAGKDDKKDEKSEKADPTVESAPLSSFQQLSSSQNAFTNLSGTGFSTNTFSFGSISSGGSMLGSGSSSLFASKSDQPLGLGLSNNGNSSLFGSSGTSIVSKSEGSKVPSMQEVPVETGEENEEAVFNADSVLYEFIDASWKERGKGEVKINVSKTGEKKARVLMRAKGNYRLILNASLYPDLKLTSMEKKGVSFACMNSTGEGSGGFSTYALKFKDGSIVDDFRAAVTAHKGKTTTALNTPENSPKASDE
ncbi:hypothetical protein UlMin_016360 [Ulmus minor]